MMTHQCSTTIICYRNERHTPTPQAQQLTSNNRHTLTWKQTLTYKHHHPSHITNTHTHTHTTWQQTHTFNTHTHIWFPFFLLANHKCHMTECHSTASSIPVTHLQISPSPFANTQQPFSFTSHTNVLPYPRSPTPFFQLPHSPITKFQLPITYYLIYFYQFPVSFFLISIPEFQIP
jgi:hypothetical protein